MAVGIDSTLVSHPNGTSREQPYAALAMAWGARRVSVNLLASSRPPYARLDDYPATLLPAISATILLLDVLLLNIFLLDIFLLNILLLGIFLLDIFLPNILLLSIFLFDLFLLDIVLLDIVLLDIVLLDIVLLDIVLLDIVLLDNLLAIILSNACTPNMFTKLRHQQRRDLD
ncbi:hypothetical protein RJ55_01248 [Drechmeria coniospora]|nr:hypothetical protein RJ55_01248 [Drechmeria coniospora]